MKTNNVPFSDDAVLIAQKIEKDQDGYDTVKETRREILCSVIDGVAYTEFYEAMKAGVNLSMSAEIWPEDWEKERVLEHNGVRYDIVRTYPSGHGTLYLSLKEVER